MTSTTARLLDDATVTAFARDGFVVVPGLLTSAELDRYGAAVTDAVSLIGQYGWSWCGSVTRPPARL